MYATWNDLLLLKKEATTDVILHEVLALWHEDKRKYPKQRWLDKIDWLKRQGWEPTGFGQLTRGARTTA